MNTKFPLSSSKDEYWQAIWDWDFLNPGYLWMSAPLTMRPRNIGSKKAEFLANSKYKR